MSLQNLVNTIKCKNENCTEMVSVGRILQDRPRECPKCKCRRYRDSRRNASKEHYRRSHARKCVKCHLDMPWVNTKGPRAEMCMACKVQLVREYETRKCIYCSTQLRGKQGVFCSKICCHKTSNIKISLRNKHVDKLEP